MADCFTKRSLLSIEQCDITLTLWYTWTLKYLLFIKRLHGDILIKFCLNNLSLGKEFHTEASLSTASISSSSVHSVLIYCLNWTTKQQVSGYKGILILVTYQLEIHLVMNYTSTHCPPSNKVLLTTATVLIYQMIIRCTVGATVTVAS